jgi:hypothetical protein
MHTQSFKDCAHWSAGNNPSASWRSAKNNATSAVTPKNIMMQRAALAQRNADQPAFGGFRRLADRFRNLARLAMTKADTTFLIANDNEGGKTKATPAFHNLGDAINMNQPVHKFAIALFPIATATAFTFTRHFLFRHLRNAVTLLAS